MKIKEKIPRLITAAVLQLAITGSIAAIAQDRRGPSPEMRAAIESCARQAGVTVPSELSIPRDQQTDAQRQTVRAFFHSIHECMESRRPSDMPGRGHFQTAPPRNDDGAGGAGQ